MPVFVHECRRCSARTEDLLRSADSSKPSHCGVEMARLMPAPFGRVVASPTPVGHRPSVPRARLRQGRLYPTGDGGVERGEVVQASRSPLPAHDSTRPAMVGPELKGKVWAKPYADSNAAERDDRWRDTTEAVATYRADCLTESGMSRGQALSIASTEQQAVTAAARAQLGQG